MQSKMNNTKTIRNLKYKIQFSLANNIQFEIKNVNYNQLLLKIHPHYNPDYVLISLSLLL